MVYIADVTGFGIIVFDYKNNRSWRVESQANHLRPISQYSNFLIAGESFNLMDGAFGLAISPKACKFEKKTKNWRISLKQWNAITDTNRQLFVHALASVSQNRISLNVLDNPANWPYQNPVINPNQFVVRMLISQFCRTKSLAQFIGNGSFRKYTEYGPGYGFEWKSIFRID